MTISRATNRRPRTAFREILRRQVFLSSNYFGDLVKKETGKTAQEYIQNKIIDLAKEMIIGSGKTVSQIAYELGYQYSQHFNRVFKKNVGYTPSEYRHLQV